MINDLLHSSPGLMNFGIFFLLAVLLLFVVLGIRHLCDLSGTEGNRFYAAS